MTRLNLGRLGVAFAAACAFTAASAAPITSWDYKVTSVFDPLGTTFTAGRSTSDGLVSASEISWGVKNGAVGTNRSALQITNSPSTGTLLTDVSSGIANTYIHKNNGALGTNSVTLQSTKIDATLGLRVTGSGGAYETYKTNYSILFAETPNVAGTCASVSVVACNDIFVLSGSLNESFIFEGFQYFVSFFAAPSLTALTSAECAAVGAAPGCFGFTTQEFRDTAVTFNLQITSRAVEVPEPGSVALLGLGLLGLAGVRARKQKNKA